MEFSVDCEVAREALSARLDGEREPVPSQRVDQHLAGCADCRAWFDRVSAVTSHLTELARPRPVPVTSFSVASRRWPTVARLLVAWPQVALLVVGLVQLVMAGLQAAGGNVGLVMTMHSSAADHGGMPGSHLLNESTSWTIALGLVMVLAAVRPTAAAGLAAVLGTFAFVLVVFIVHDVSTGEVTTARILTHVPVLIGAALALLVWRTHSLNGPGGDTAAAEPEIVLPRHASRGRRRGHLWPTDGSAA